jgi:hypothetical protein
VTHVTFYKKVKAESFTYLKIAKQTQKGQESIHPHTSTVLTPSHFRDLQIEV